MGNHERPSNKDDDAVPVTVDDGTWNRLLLTAANSPGRATWFANARTSERQAKSN